MDAAPGARATEKPLYKGSPRLADLLNALAAESLACKPLLWYF